VSSRGTRRENAVKDWLELQGWWVARAAGSFGDADLVALKCPYYPPFWTEHPHIGNRVIEHGKLLVEVKSTTRSPFADFGPQDRSELLQAATKAGAQAVLCWWPPRGKMTWLWPETDWPSPRAKVDCRGDRDCPATEHIEGCFASRP
jgi:Holliday junction resolvase